MLRPIKRDRKNCYSTLDIETGPSGEVLDIAIYDGEGIDYFSCWAALVQFIEVHIEEKKYRKFIAHYGGAFDYVSFVEYLTNQTQIKFDVVLSQSKIVILFVYFGDYRVEFIDSSNVFLGTSLAALCDIFKVEHGKMEGVDRKNILALKRRDPESYYKYLGLDVISLFEVCKSFERYLEIDFFPVTIASLAMYLYRRRFQKYLLFKPRKAVDEFISEAYAGGRVECFRPGKHDSVRSYDINSLYPSVMRNAKFPVGTPVLATKFHPGKVGVYKVRFDQTDRTIPPILWVKDNKNGLEFVYKGMGYFFDAELKLAMDNGVKVKVEKGYVWIRSEYLFREFVDHYYKLRCENRGNAMYYITKILLNSLYGKFGQRENKAVLMRLDAAGLDKFLRDPETKVKPYDPEKGLYEVFQPRPVEHRIVNIAAQVTAMGRARIGREIVRNHAKVVYCDTDSLHLTGRLPARVISTELGKWKAEEAGVGIYTGRKQYSIEAKVKFKGIKAKDTLGTGLVLMTAADIESISNGKTLKRSYSYFPQIKSVLRGGKTACRIYEVEKRAKRSDYQTNFSPP